MVDHQQCLEILADDIYIYIILLCQTCDHYMEFDHIGQDLVQWSKQMAILALEAGWTCGKDEKYNYCYCPNCKS